MTTAGNSSNHPNQADHPLSDKPILEKCMAALIAVTVAVLAVDLLSVLAVILLPRWCQ